MVYRKIRNPSRLCLVILTILLSFYTQYQILNTKYCLAESNIGLTARVPDERPPNPIILIAPANGSYLNTPYPEFVFQRTTDDASTIWYYQLWLNDQLYIDELPALVSSIQTADFNLWVEAENIHFNLKTPLEEGNYVWKIRAVDTYSNWIDSALWTFTLDLTPPIIIVTQVAEYQDLNLSSADPGSITSDTDFTTTSSRPVIKGRSEPGAAVKLILSRSDKQFSWSTTADRQGFFSFTPDQDLAAGSYLVKLSASDPASNTTSLTPFKLTITISPHFLSPHLIAQLKFLLATPVCGQINYRWTSYILIAIVICLLIHFLMLKLKRQSYPLPLYLAIGLGLVNLFVFSSWLNFGVIIGLVVLLLIEAPRIFRCTNSPNNQSKSEIEANQPNS